MSLPSFWIDQKDETKSIRAEGPYESAIDTRCEWRICHPGSHPRLMRRSSMPQIPHIHDREFLRVIVPSFF